MKDLRDTSTNHNHMCTLLEFQLKQTIALVIIEESLSFRDTHWNMKWYNVWDLLQNSIGRR